MTYVKIELNQAIMDKKDKCKGELTRYQSIIKIMDNGDFLGCIQQRLGIGHKNVLPMENLIPKQQVGPGCK